MYNLKLHSSRNTNCFWLFILFWSLDVVGECCHMRCIPRHPQNLNNAQEPVVVMTSCAGWSCMLPLWTNVPCCFRLSSCIHTIIYIYIVMRTLFYNFSPYWSGGLGEGHFACMFSKGSSISSRTMYIHCCELKLQHQESLKVLQWNLCDSST